MVLLSLFFIVYRTDSIVSVDVRDVLFCSIVVGNVITDWPCVFGACTMVLIGYRDPRPPRYPPRPPVLPGLGPPPDLVFPTQCLYFVFDPNGRPGFFFIVCGFVDPNDVKELMFDCCVLFWLDTYSWVNSESSSSSCMQSSSSESSTGSSSIALDIVSVILFRIINLRFL